MENETTSPEVSLDSWAIIELFGHTRIAGKCSNVSIAGCGFIRVQVPAHGGMPEYTRDIAPKAVYAINPCDEAAARAALSRCDESPVSQLTYAAVQKAFMEQQRTHTAALTNGTSDDHEHDYSDDDDDDDHWAGRGQPKRLKPTTGHE